MYESFMFLVPDSYVTLVGQRQAPFMEYYKHSVCFNEPLEAPWQPDVMGTVTDAAIQMRTRSTRGLAHPGRTAAQQRNTDVRKRVVRPLSFQGGSGTGRVLFPAPRVTEERTDRPGVEDWVDPTTATAVLP